MRKLGILVLSLVCAAAFGADIKHPRGTSAAEVRGIVATSTVPAAAVASALVSPSGSSTWTIDGDMLTIVSTTNTVDFVITATNGAGYNGPAVGTVYSLQSDVEGALTFENTEGDPATASYAYETEDMHSAFGWLVVQGEPSAQWVQANGGAGLPRVLYPSTGASGTMTIAWLTYTTNVVYDLSSLKVP